MNSNFSFKIFNQLEEKLKEDWLALEQNSNFFFFQKYYYAKNLIEVFKINLFFIAVVYDKNKPVAIFPLEIKSYKKVKILQWLGSNQSDYCCPIIKNDIFKDHQKFEFIWEEILKEIENFDIIFLNKQPEYIEKTSNPFVQFLKNVFHSKAYQIELSKIDDNLSYIKNNKFTSEFKRTKKKLTENYQVEFQNYFLANQIDLIDELHQDGMLKIRMYAMIQNDSSSINHFLKTGPYKTDRLNVRSVKVYVDGALGSRGALLIDDYSDRKGHRGIIVTPIDSISKLAFKLAGTKFQMNTHAIGDRANRIVLNAYRDALFDYRDPRWRIEHAQVISEDDIDLFNYKIIPSVQPTHATSDMYWLYDRIGKKRAENAYAYKSLLNKSNVIALGTDFPVEDVSPIMTFYSAVVRKDINEYPEDGFQTENALSRLEALIGMTRHGAYANFEENEKGSIEVGKFADFIILDNDLLDIRENRIPNTKIVATFVNGELVFNRRFN